MVIDDTGANKSVTPQLLIQSLYLGKIKVIEEKQYT
jgi:hypothetical protein